MPLPLPSLITYLSPPVVVVGVHHPFRVVAEVRVVGVHPFRVVAGVHLFRVVVVAAVHPLRVVAGVHLLRLVAVGVHPLRVVVVGLLALFHVLAVGAWEPSCLAFSIFSF